MINSKKIVLIGLAFTLASCASARAAKVQGVSVKSLSRCTNLVCIQSLPTATKVDEKKLANGKTRYVYRVQRKQGSVLRSIGYGVAAITTVGFSEILAGPVEGTIQDNKHMAAIADCDDIGDCDRLVIAQYNKAPIVVRGQTPEEIAADQAAKKATETKKP